MNKAIKYCVTILCIPVAISHIPFAMPGDVQSFCLCGLFVGGLWIADSYDQRKKNRGR